MNSAKKKKKGKERKKERKNDQVAISSPLITDNRATIDSPLAPSIGGNVTAGMDSAITWFRSGNAVGHGPRGCPGTSDESLKLYLQVSAAIRAAFRTSESYYFFSPLPSRFLFISFSFFFSFFLSFFHFFFFLDWVSLEFLSRKE